MQRVIIPAFAALCLAFAPLVAFAASAKPETKAKTTPDAPRFLGGAKGWNAYAAGDKKTLVCYLVGHPTKSEPANVMRGRVALSVTQRPRNKSFNVVEFALGYPAKEHSNAELAIDGKKYPPLFTHGESAWNRSAAGDKAVTMALMKGQKATIKAVSERGTTTTDTYALDGFTKALTLIDKACSVKP